MKPLTCASARRRLQAYHDRELGVPEQIAVGAHLEWCEACAAELSEMRQLGAALQFAATRHAAPSRDEAAVFTATVVSKFKAEENASLFARVRDMFEDMHLVYAGLGATAATLACAVIMLSMMRFATTERPDSLAGIMSVMATPLECVGIDGPDPSVCRERWSERFQRANESAEQDAVFTLEAVLTRQGRLPSLATLRHGRHGGAAGDAMLVEGLLDVVSRARLDGAQLPHAPVGGAQVLWLVQHATVRATKQPALDVPLPPKKRAASLVGSIGIRA